MSNIILTRAEYEASDKSAENLYLISDEDNLYKGIDRIWREFRAPLLPDGYTPCDYIYSNDNVAKIMSFGNILSEPYSIDVDYTALSIPPNWRQYSYIGDGALKNDFTVVKYSDTELQFILEEDGHQINGYSVPIDNTMHHLCIEYGASILRGILDDKPALKWDLNFVGSSRQAQLLVRNSEPCYAGMGKLKYTKLSDLTVMFNGIPCTEDSTGKVGYYDLISHRFIFSETTSNFVAGFLNEGE